MAVSRASFGIDVSFYTRISRQQGRTCNIHILVEDVVCQTIRKELYDSMKSVSYKKVNYEGSCITNRTRK